MVKHKIQLKYWQQQAIFPAVAILAVIAVNLFLKFNGLYGQDAHEYLRYSTALNDWFTLGKNPGDYFWPVNYPLLGAVLSLFGMSELVALQLISAISIGSMALLLYRWIAPDTGNRSIAFLYVFWSFGCCPLLLRAGLLCMSDAFAITCFLTAFYGFNRWLQYDRLSHFVVMTFFAVCAVSTRYAMAILLLPMILFVIYILTVRKKWLAISLGIITVAISLIPHFLLKDGTAFLGHSFLSDWSIQHYFSRTFVMVDGVMHYKIPNILYILLPVFHWSLFWPSLFLIPFTRSSDFQDKSLQLLLAGTVIYLMFLAGIPFQNKRFLLPVLPVLVLILYPAFKRFYASLKRFKVHVVLPILLLSIQAYAFIQYFKPIWYLNQFEKQAALKMHETKGKLLYTFTIDMALNSYNIPQKTVNLWAGEYKTFVNGELVLFHAQKFETQWAGKNPMINWNRLSSEFELTTIHSFPNGWKLYRIQKPIN